MCQRQIFCSLGLGNMAGPHLLASLAVSCGHVAEFWPMECEWKLQGHFQAWPIKILPCLVFALFLHHQMNGEEAEDREDKVTIRKEPVSSNDSPHPKPFFEL